ncbi:MAG: EscV/YscV/HrcV family type III secretion system export apparatus protein [unclassified Hahellaceae]|nr:EscV/YscV/HrcV family type III secretion system export apparatus protein [Hahellaceae bacterium]|tara:strand:- start:26610 stop:28760 length:2151 start_codon:yes stop_codon:yes gene_type:complete
MTVSSVPAHWLNRLTGSLRSQSYSDVVLAFGVVAIIALMILPLPLFVVDILVAVNIIIAVAMVLLSIYVPSPLAFSSFPSVILLTTLFRLSLSIAITRLILLDADAGDIIETFGNLVVGGNMVVGFVVFLIITVVQFIVIAKGAERVAEVAARFSLDAMPGKQLSIDSDLRSGLIEKEEAKAKRRRLEQESQLHGALDGAMKFVKGDAIAGIVILIVNILGGLTIGVLQRGMPIGEAVSTYSVLTIGDGLVAQIPALLTSIAAGMLITRTSGDDSRSNLAQEIGFQFFAFPRITVLAGVLSLLLAIVPGFPSLVFLLMGVALLTASVLRQPPAFLRSRIPSLEARYQRTAVRIKPVEPDNLQPPAAVVLWVHPGLNLHFDKQTLLMTATAAVNDVRERYGVPVPVPVIREDTKLGAGGYLLEAHGMRIGRGSLPTESLAQDVYFLHADTAPGLTIESSAQPVSGTELALVPDFSPQMAGNWQQGIAASGDAEMLSPGERLQPLDTLRRHLCLAMLRQLPLFLGVQETATLVNNWSGQYPDLIKEMLRAVPPQRLTEVLKRLLQEGVSIRNLRDIFEAVSIAGAREADVGLLTEQVRLSVRRQLGDQYGGMDRMLYALLVHPELEDKVHQAIRNSKVQASASVSPDLYQKISGSLRELLVAAHDKVPVGQQPVVLCSPEVRRYFRALLEEEFFNLPVLSYQELIGELRIQQLGQINA